MFLRTLRLDGFLSFPPGCAPIALTNLNVLIGPNGSGKTNLIEAIEVLRAAPTGLAGLFREGGTAQEWIWKGEPTAKVAEIDVVVAKEPKKRKSTDIRYRFAFGAAGLRLEVVDESISDAGAENGAFHYRFNRGKPIFGGNSPTDNPHAKNGNEPGTPGESILFRRGSTISPSISSLGRRYEGIVTFRDWSFGRSAPLRRPQPADLPVDALLSKSENLALLLNKLENSDSYAEFNRLLKRFLPRFERLSTRIYGNMLQVNVHEEGLGTPVPATRLSDGTLRFLALLALLLAPDPPPLLCVEEPELGLHPDAVTLFAEVLVEASSRMQLIVTTHSDALVSALTPNAESVLVCENIGGTRVKRVDGTQIAKWLEDYQLGEIWQIGALGGNP